MVESSEKENDSEPKVTHTCLKGYFRGKERLPPELPHCHSEGAPSTWFSALPGAPAQPAEVERSPGRRGPASARPPRGGAGAPVTWAAAAAILQGGGGEEPRGTGVQTRPPIRGGA